jgi:hypothetical protein
MREWWGRLARCVPPREYHAGLVAGLGLGVPAGAYFVAGPAMPDWAVGWVFFVTPALAIAAMTLMRSGHRDRASRAAVAETMN